MGAARELERKERQVDELSLQGATLSQRLAERESEVTATTERAAALEHEPECTTATSAWTAGPMQAEFEATQLLRSCDDEDEHLGDMPTLAALRQRLYSQVDSLAGGSAPRSTPGARAVCASTGGSSGCSVPGGAEPGGGSGTAS